MRLGDLLQRLTDVQVPVPLRLIGRIGSPECQPGGDASMRI